MTRRTLAIAVLIFGTILAYLYFSILAPLREWSVLFWSVTAILAAIQIAVLWLPLFYWALDSTESFPHEILLERIAHLAMGFLSFLLFLTVSRDLVSLALIPFGKGSTLGGPTGSLAIFGATTLLGFIGMARAWAGPVVRRIALSPNLTTDRIRIVQISDLHVGTWIGRRYVEKVVRQIEALGPIDLLVLTGDIGDGDPKRHIEDLAPLGKIAARLGKFSVSGNHEGYWNEAEWNLRIRELGFQVLENESVRVTTPLGPISIHGVSDVNADPARALASVKPNVYSIFLAHKPGHAEAAIAAGVRLQLSGHTHAGQFLPWSLFIRFAHRFAKGLYRHGETAIYVNSGTGFWGPPFRLGTRSETTLLEFSLPVR